MDTKLHGQLHHGNAARIPQGLWFIGLTWMCIVMTLMLARSSYLLVTGDIGALQRLCGVRSAQAEEEAANGERLIKSERAGKSMIATAMTILLVLIGLSIPVGAALGVLG